MVADIQYDFTPHLWGPNKGGYNPALVPEWQDWLAKLNADWTNCVATTDGGMPRCGWGAVLAFELREGVPSVLVNSFLGASWHTVMALGDLRLKESNRG